MGTGLGGPRYTTLGLQWDVRVSLPFPSVGVNTDTGISCQMSQRLRGEDSVSLFGSVVTVKGTLYLGPRNRPL